MAYLLFIQVNTPGTNINLGIHFDRCFPQLRGQCCRQLVGSIAACVFDLSCHDITGGVHDAQRLTCLLPEFDSPASFGCRKRDHRFWLVAFRQPREGLLFDDSAIGIKTNGRLILFHIDIDTAI